MVQQVKIDRQALMSQMQGTIERAMERVAQAVNAAADGQWLAGSEDEVSQIMADLRQQTYQTALQMRADAGEASFFPSDR
jgi:hypothetical protein